MCLDRQGRATGSSPVVPAIRFKHLRQTEGLAKHRKNVHPLTDGSSWSSLLAISEHYANKFALRAALCRHHGLRLDIHRDAGICVTKEFLDQRLNDLFPQHHGWITNCPNTPV